MIEFWNSLLTEKSWALLQELRKEYNFVLIGGWAVYLFTKRQKSKDIDIVVSINELQKFKAYGLMKNDDLKKYEIKRDDIDIDIYAEYYSKLIIPVEEIKNYAVKIEGFNVICPELLLILKQAAYNARKDSIKGEKDLIDIMSLILLEKVDFKKYESIVKKYRLENYFSDLVRLIKIYKDYDKVGMNAREFKIKKNKILKIILS